MPAELARKETVIVRSVTQLLQLAVCLAAYSTAKANSLDAEPRAIKSAIRKSILLLEKAAAGSTEHRKCFTCHGHAFPVLALVEARKRGFTIDEQNLQSQLKHTATDLARGKAGYLEGRGQGGGHIRAGYALWTLQVGDWKPDEVTTATTGYLIWDDDARHWRSSANRPPSEVSPFTATYVALRGLDAFGTAMQEERISVRKTKSLAWLLDTEAKETEDQVFRLLALDHLKADEDAIQATAAQLIEAQRDNGGWAQIADQISDAYATGSALYALHRADSVSPSDEVYQRGVKFLLGSQLEDGSWHVRSRSKPFQTYYESGFPHGKDQFISTAASSWATLALLFACAKEGTEGEQAAQTETDSTSPVAENAVGGAERAASPNPAQSLRMPSNAEEAINETGHAHATCCKLCYRR